MPLASIRIEQVWSDVPDGNGKGKSWTWEPFFKFGVPSPVTFHMAFHRAGAVVDIPKHQLEFTTTKIVAEVWDARIDVDGDGIADGDYVQKTFVEDAPGFDAPVRPHRSKNDRVPTRSDLVVWNPVLATSSTGRYISNETIIKNPYCIIDSVIFYAYDNDGYEIEGDTGE